LAVDLTTVCSTCVLCVPWLSPLPPPSTLFPYTTLFRSDLAARGAFRRDPGRRRRPTAHGTVVGVGDRERAVGQYRDTERVLQERSEEHTSELQSRENLVCRLLLEKKKEAESIYTRHDKR